MAGSKNAALILILTLQLCSATLELFNFRARDHINKITLICRNGYDQQSGVMFWRGCTAAQDSERCLVIIRDSSDGKINFTINRTLEGSYYCGWSLNDVSPELKLIAYPDPSIKPVKETSYAEVGTTARINCPISPGELLSQYYVDWVRVQPGNIPSIVASVIGPRSSDSAPPSKPRFKVDPDTFSLLISDVSLNDSGFYRCELGVKAPVDAGGHEFQYDQLINVNLNLIIYQSPHITLSPMRQILTVSSSQNATFHCGARGVPRPQIKWSHDFVQEHLVTTKVVYTDESTVTSTLTVMAASASHSGEVKCTAEANLTGVEIQPVSATALLIVQDCINQQLYTKSASMAFCGP